MQGHEATVGLLEKLSLDAAFSSDGLGNEVAGRTIQVITEDALGTPEGAVDAAKKLVESDQVCAIFGPTEIGQKFAVAQYCESVGIPLLLYCPSPSSIASGEWVLAVAGVNEQYGTCMGDYLHTHLGYNTITCLTEEGMGGDVFFNPLKATFTAEGGAVVQDQRAPEGTVDFTSYLAALEPADALVAWEAGDCAIALLNQWIDGGYLNTWPIQGAFHGGFLDPFVVNAIYDAGGETQADALVGACCPMEWAPDADTPENTFMLGVINPLMLDQFHYTAGDDASSGPWSAAVLFMEAVKSTNGDTTPAILLAALKTVSVETPNGPICLNGGQIATINMYIVTVTKHVTEHGTFYNYSTAYTYENVPPTGYVPE
jgi:branched-chain amino acid transport system substrate-binding protein